MTKELRRMVEDASLRELVMYIKALAPCRDVEAVFREHPIDQKSKIFILYASVGECYDPNSCTLGEEDEYVLALGRFINSGRRITLPPDPVEIIHEFRERMAKET